MALTLEKSFEEGFNVVPIHDCFYAHPKYINNIRNNYYEPCCALYNLKPLKTFVGTNKENVSDDTMAEVKAFIDSLP